MAMRWVTVALLVLLGLVQAGLWVGDGGLTHAMRLQIELDGLHQRIGEQQRGNARLLAEVEDLKSGLEMVEERARGELGMIKSNEVFVQYAGPRH
jgi:cell division protein FtsB